MSEVRSVCTELRVGKSVTRALLNIRLRDEILRGTTIDVGGGKNADYIAFMQRSDDCVLETFDVKAGATIDFETDRLPAQDGAYDTVLFLNVMEHIYNYQHIAKEVVRIMKVDGQLIGFVPFLMWYHPDHSDYFRYTHEALEKIFREAGATHISVEPIARGPFTAAAQMIYPSIPRLLRIPLLVPLLLLDRLFTRLRPGHQERYALGYFFIVHKG